MDLFEGWSIAPPKLLLFIKYMLLMAMSSWGCEALVEVPALETLTLTAGMEVWAGSLLPNFSAKGFWSIICGT